MAAQEPPPRRVTQLPGAAPPAQSAKPSLTVPQLLAVAAFILFVLLAWFAADPSDSDATLTAVEYEKLRTLTLFLIGALLPSDALIRFGRGILFTKVDDPDEAAKEAKPTTEAQLLAFVVYGLVVVAMLAGNDIVTDTEGTQIIDVAQTLIVALLPSDAAIRFGRALHLSKKPELMTIGQMKRV